MRKVLLATTALVALGGVSAASADISVSAANEFKYKSWSDNTAETGGANKNSFSNTTSYEISASVVTDNGLAMNSYILQDGTSDGSWDDFGFSIAGDFGTLGFAGSEAGDKFATATDVTPDETNTIDSAVTALPGDEHINSADVSYLSPNISGFQFSVGLNEVGSADDSMMGAQYSISSGETTITVKYATQSGGKASTAATATETDATSTGLVLANGPFSVTVASNTKTVATNGATTYDYNISSIGGTYKMSDSLTVSAYTGTTEDDKDSSHEMTDTAFGVAYTITPGLVFNVTHNSWDLKDNDLSANESGDVTSVALNLSF